MPLGKTLGSPLGNPVGSKPPAAAGGGAVVPWWQARIAAVTPDPYWDDVKVLLQIHPDDCTQDYEGESTSPDRKDPGILYTNKRGTTTSPTRTSSRFMEFVNGDEERNLPLGCGHVKNQYGYLSAQGTFDPTSLEPHGNDWTFEVVVAPDVSANTTNHGGSAHAVWNVMGASNGYDWGTYANEIGSGQFRNNAFYVAQVAKYFGLPAVSDINGDPSAAWHRGTIGVKNLTWFYDHSATAMCMACDGILMPTYITTANFSGYNSAAATDLIFNARMDATANKALSDPTWGYTCAARLTMADRYGISGSMATKGYPALFTPDHVFAEVGA